MIQLLLHLLGDFILQSEPMAAGKRGSSFWAGFHALVYALPFWLLGPSWAAWSLICGSHFVIDRWGLARRVIWAKNLGFGLWPKWLCRKIGSGNAAGTEDGTQREDPWRNECERFAWRNCKATGYPKDLEPWLAATLLIVADNTLHLLVNWSCLRWL